MRVFQAIFGTAVGVQTGDQSGWWSSRARTGGSRRRRSFCGGVRGPEETDDQLQAVHLGPRLEVGELGALVSPKLFAILFSAESFVHNQAGDPLILGVYEGLAPIDADALLVVGDRALGLGELSLRGPEP